MAYTNKTKIENYLNISIKTAGQARLDVWIAAVTKYIENYTGRTFEVSQTPTQRLFDTDGGTQVLIDECFDVTEVSDEGDTIDSSNYRLTPANTDQKESIKLVTGAFSSGIQNLRVTAKYGYSETPPEDIQMAATILVAGIVNQSNQHKKELRTVSVGRYTASFKDDKFDDYELAMNILKEYKRVTI